MGPWMLRATHPTLCAVGFPRILQVVPDALRIEFVDPSAVFRLRGFVLDPDGKPLPHARVSLAWVDVSHPNSLRVESDPLTRSSRSGRFDVAYLARRRLHAKSWIVASHADFGPAIRQVDWTDEFDRENLTLSLQSGDRLRVEFRDRATGQQLPGIGTLIMEDRCPLLPTWIAEEDPSAGLRGMRAGRWSSNETGLVAIDNWPAQSSVRLRVYSNPQASFRVTAVSTPGGTIDASGRLVTFPFAPGATTILDLECEKGTPIILTGDASKLTIAQRASARILLDHGHGALSRIRDIEWNKRGVGEFSAIGYIDAKAASTQDLYVILSYADEQIRRGPYRVTTGATIAGLRFE